MSSKINVWLFLLLINCSTIANAQLSVLLNSKKVLPVPPSDSLTQKERSLIFRQYRNKEAFERIKTFSKISWACLPYMDVGSEKKFYILSADILPHLFIGGERLPFVLDLVPRYKVRIFRDNEEFHDSSLAVRTPSYMPGAILSIPLNMGKDSTFTNLTYLSLSFFHHSNGQDGEEFEAPGKFNYYNGNFSTNFIEGTVTFNWRKRSDKPSSFNCRNFNRNYTDYVLRIGLEQHFLTSDTLKPTYGATRLNIEGSMIKVYNNRWLIKKQNSSNESYQLGNCYYKELFRIVPALSFILDEVDAPMDDLSKRINVEVSGYLRIAGGNTALFTTIGYYGSDPYNIYYSKSYAFMRLGIALGNFVNTNKL